MPSLIRKRTTPLSIVLTLLGIAIFVVCFNAWLAFRSVQALTESQSWVLHTWHVIDALTNITDSLKDAESGDRGYLLTGDKDYLAPYVQAKRDLPDELQAVAKLTADNAEQQKALRELRAVIESRMSLLDQSIEEREAGDADSIHLLVINGTGLTEMNHVRALVAKMRASEEALRVQRAARSSRDAWRARESVIFASSVDLLLILLTFRYILSERTLRVRADETAKHLEKLQSISEVALMHLGTADLTAELLSRAQKAIDAEMVLLCSRFGDSLMIEATAGVPIPRGTLMPPSDGPLEKALRDDRIVLLADSSSTMLRLNPLLYRTRSLLVAPLSGPGAATGILVAGHESIGAFDGDDLEILRVTADRIAVAMDRSHAYEAQQQARRDAESRAAEVRSLNAQLEERVRLRTADLEASNRELEAFSYSVSHDLRAPLRTVDGFSLALEEDYGALIDGHGLDYLRRIREGVQRMGQLIDSLLQLSRVTRAETSQERVDLSELARTIAADLSVQNETRTITFAIHPGLECVGDPRLLRAAFENLLENAVKFTSRTPRAEIEVGRSDGAYFVRDNGAGFDMRYVDKLFGAFNRLHGDREFRGSGIGLATVARIIRRHHGKIWAEGEVGRGATFWFTLR
ncbi:MAG TPA: CHASE3 domain-containing protein [Acidobacteriaceae bacterium]|nr:CHASE3 domain-containing protein [Acidobacteriaceae bacterium]